MELEIGSRLNTIRKEKGYSISTLSQLSNVSTGLISQLERGLVVPSVVNLWRLAQALDTDISYFFDKEIKADKTIIRKGEHRIIVTDNECAEYKLLSPNDPKRVLDMAVVTLKCGDYYSAGAVSHEGEECGYVLKGTLTVLLNGEEHILEEGDSIFFKCNQPHKYINNSQDECISIWSMTPTFF